MNNTAIQQTVSQGHATPEAMMLAMQAQINALIAENAKLKTSRAGKLSFKVSEKGAISVCGMRQFPVTLYRGEWIRLLAVTKELEAFINANEAVLKTLGTWEKQP